LYHGPVIHARDLGSVGYRGISRRRMVSRVGWLCWGTVGLDAAYGGVVAMRPVVLLRRTLLGEALRGRAEWLSVKAQMIGFCLHQRPEIDMPLEDTQKVGAVH